MAAAPPPAAPPTGATGWAVGRAGRTRKEPCGRPAHHSDLAPRARSCASAAATTCTCSRPPRASATPGVQASPSAALGLGA
ncbi:hypothetical protein FOA52_013129 [Chlamydomonas sp. UWO 241]|nr:hypothetical protein FOA52_013129 [Chlamydomonas sp. UWO 241]